MLQTSISLLPIASCRLPLAEIPVAGAHKHTAFLLTQKSWSSVSNSVFGVHGKKKMNPMMFQVMLKSKHHVTYFIIAFLLGRLIFLKDHFDHILPPKHLRLLIH